MTVFIVFGLAYLMTKKTGVGILAAFLFAVSFESTQYATWLSNPTVGIWTVPLIYLGLWLWLEKKNKFAPVVTALGLGLSIQAEIFLAYHIVPLIIWLVVKRKNITRKHILTFIILFLATTSTMIAGEIKFGFRSLEGLKALAVGSGGNLAYASSLGDYLVLYLNQIGRIFAFNSYPGNLGYGGAFVFCLAIYFLVKKDKIGIFLSTWLFSHITVVSVGGVSTPFLMVGIGPAVSVLIAYFLSKLKSVVLVLLILSTLIFGNISTILKENPKGSTLFAIQKDMLLTKQLSAVEYTYSNSNGEEFSINSLTLPLWTNIVWAYLYDWYGQQKYGYSPCFVGHDQIGQIIALQKCEIKEKDHFLIVEPMNGIPPRYLGETIGEEDVDTKLVFEEYYGELRVQKRIPVD